MSNEKQKVDYRVDALGVIRNLFLAGIALLVRSAGHVRIYADVPKHGDRVYRGGVLMTASYLFKQQSNPF